MKRNMLLAVLALSVVMVFGVAVGSSYASFDGSQGNNCSSCHPGTPDRVVGGGEEGDISTATPDATLPVSTCNSVGNYYGDAAIRLTGNDTGWGMRYLYHAVNGGITRLTTCTPYTYASYSTTITLKAPASGWTTYTVDFHSQDGYGNVEGLNTVAVRVNAPKTTAASVRSSAYTTYRGRYITLSGALTGGVPAGTRVSLEMVRPGLSGYRLLSTRTVGSTGVMSAFKYKVGLRGTYYFRVKYAGATSFKAATSKYIKVVVK